MRILGVRIDNFSKKEILEKIGMFLSEEETCLPAGRFHQITTINPEFIIHAQKDKDFFDILNGSALNVADGVGLKYAFLRHCNWLKYRLAGADLMHEILYLAYKHDYSVCLAINKFGLSTFEDVKTKLQEMYPGLEVSGLDLDPENQQAPQLKCSTIMFCNFGAPHQEKFINSLKNGTIRVAMGVGGSFDFLTGKTRRAPIIMRFFGLEWLWRLLLQSWNDKKFLKKRWKRMYKAVIIFPLRVLINK